MFLARLTLFSFMSRAERITSRFILVSIDVSFGLISLVGKHVLTFITMENVEMSVKDKVRVVRRFLDYDGPKFDPGCDCSVDMMTGEVIVSKTKQSFKEECDINTIMRRYETTGVIDHVNKRKPEFGDFADVVSFQEGLDIVRHAQEEFANLSARVRDRFGNDPAQFLAFMDNPDNKAEAIKLGIVMPPKPEAPPQKVEVVNPPQPKGPEGRQEPAGGPATSEGA